MFHFCLFVLESFIGFFMPNVCCCVHDCFANNRKYPGLIFHRLPKEEKIFASWLRLIRDRALERMGVETSQLALARCVMRGVLGRERSRGRTVEKWRVKTKFCSTYKVHCYG